MESSTKLLFYLPSSFNMTSTIETVGYTEINVGITITDFKIYGRTIVK